MNDHNPYQAPATDDLRPSDLPLRLASGIGYMLTLIAGIGAFTATLGGAKLTLEDSNWGVFGVTLGFAAASVFCWRLAVRIHRYRSYLRKAE